MIRIIRPEERPLTFLQEELAKQPKEVRELVIKGVDVINATIAANPNFGIRCPSDDTVVFPLNDEIAPKIRELLTRFCDLAGYEVQWKSKIQDGKITELNTVNLTPKDK